MQFVELSPRHKKGLEKLFSQLTGQEKTNMDVDIMLEEKRNFYAVMEENGELIGFGALVLYYVPTHGLVSRLEDIIVDESQRGKGYGKILVENLINHAKEQGVSQIDLTSNPKRVAAHKLYESLGFKKRDTETYRKNICE